MNPARCDGGVTVRLRVCYATVTWKVLPRLSLVARVDEGGFRKMQPTRTCQSCTACCDGWVQMVIGGVPVYPGHPCPHSTGCCCDDYENRPEDPCRRFECGWVARGSPLPIWMKPNRGKVIVFFNKTSWAGLPVDLAVPVGKRIPQRSLSYLKEFSRRNNRPLIYTEQIVESGDYQRQQQTFAYGPPDFQRDVLRQRQEGRLLWSSQYRLRADNQSRGHGVGGAQLPDDVLESDPARLGSRR